jgi:hypothetical protein
MIATESPTPVDLRVITLERRSCVLPVSAHPGYA